MNEEQVQLMIFMVMLLIFLWWVVRDMKQMNGKIDKSQRYIRWLEGIIRLQDEELEALREREGEER